MVREARTPAGKLKETCNLFQLPERGYEAFPGLEPRLPALAKQQLGLQKCHLHETAVAVEFQEQPRRLVQILQVLLGLERGRAALELEPDEDERLQVERFGRAKLAVFVVHLTEVVACAF